MASDASLVARLYQVFADYPSGRAFDCLNCYSEEELAYFETTPLLQIPIRRLESMLGETGDHWKSTEAYKHFLPRLLEVMGPPHFVEDIYPEHLFKTLLYHAFKEWPAKEQAAVLDYLRALTAVLQFSDDLDRQEWTRGLNRIS